MKIEKSKGFKKIYYNKETRIHKRCELNTYIMIC